MTRNTATALLLLAATVGVTHVGLTATAVAQMPRTISYQGTLTDPSGAPVADGSHTVTLTLYSAASGGSSVYSESHGVTTVRGYFSLRIGSVTPIPSTLRFDAPLWLGVSVDGASELSPRTPLDASPYALHASVAEVAGGLLPGAGGVVTSINGGEGAITLVGSGGTTVNRNGSTITISSTGGGSTGIGGVQSSDGTITVTSPNGPIADLSVANGAISSMKLADNAVTGAKLADGSVTGSEILDGSIGGADIEVGAITLDRISSAGATAGQVLSYTGTGLAFTTPAGLALPFAGTAAGGQDAFAVTETGTGSVATFTLNNGTSANNAVEIASNGSGVGLDIRVTGTGRAAYLEQANAAAGTDAFGSVVRGSGNAIYGGSSGTGRGGWFQILNSASSSAAVEASTTGSGAGVKGVNSATTGTVYGVTGEVSSTSNNAAGLFGRSRGTTGLGSGVFAQNDGVGYGLFATSASGIGVYGTSAGNSGVIGSTGVSLGGAQAHAGVTGRNSSTTGTDNWGVVGTTSAQGGGGVAGFAGNGAHGVLGWASGTGAGVKGEYGGSGAGTALEVANGAIKVSGTNRSVYTHTVTTGAGGNTCIVYGTGATATILNNPLLNNDPNAMVIVTLNGGTNGSAFSAPVAVMYDNGSLVLCSTGRWVIYTPSGVAIPNGTKFNVMIVKQ